MYPEIRFLGKTVGTYGLCSVIGLALAVLVGWILAKRWKKTIDDVLLLALSIAVGLFLGGHLLYGITRADIVISAFRQIGRIPAREWFSILSEGIGGMVFYGGFLGGLCGILLFTRFTPLFERKNALDLYAVVTPLFHTFGRIGCFFGGCCYGREWSHGVLIAENRLNPSVAGVPRFPVQLVEAGCEFLIFLLLLTLFRHKRLDGKLLLVYLTVYPAARFVLEFWRGDRIRGVWFGLSTSQWISLVLFASAVGILIYQINKKQKTARSTDGRPSL